MSLVLEGNRNSYAQGYPRGSGEGPLVVPEVFPKVPWGNGKRKEGSKFCNLKWKREEERKDEHPPSCVQFSVRFRTLGCPPKPKKFLGGPAQPLGGVPPPNFFQFPHVFDSFSLEWGFKTPMDGFPRLRASFWCTRCSMGPGDHLPGVE